MLQTDISPLQHSVLDGLTEQQLAALDTCAVQLTFDAGKRIIEQGKRADRFYLIQSGRVSVEVYSPERGPRPIQTVGAGNVLGATWMLPPRTWQFDARALEPTEVIAFDARSVQELCDSDPQLSAALMKGFMVAIAQRLDAAQKQLLSLLSGRPAS